MWIARCWICRCHSFQGSHLPFHLMDTFCNSSAHFFVIVDENEFLVSISRYSWPFRLRWRLVSSRIQSVREHDRSLRLAWWHLVSNRTMWSSWSLVTVTNRFETVSIVFDMLGCGIRSRTHQVFRHLWFDFWCLARSLVSPIPRLRSEANLSTWADPETQRCLSILVSTGTSPQTILNRSLHTLLFQSYKRSRQLSRPEKASRLPPTSDINEFPSPPILYVVTEGTSSTARSTSPKAVLQHIHMVHLLNSYLKLQPRQHATWPPAFVLFL